MYSTSVFSQVIRSNHNFEEEYGLRHISMEGYPTFER